MEFTAIGDSVNVASRVESLTKVVGEPLLVTRDTCRALREAAPLEPLPPQYVKGHHAPVEVLRLARPSGGATLDHAVGARLSSATRIVSGFRA